MDAWNRWIEFFTCGLMVLPATLWAGTGSFVVFATTLGLMQVLLIAVVCGAPTVSADPKEAPERAKHRPPPKD